jgi:protein tyrosine phosphatase
MREGEREREDGRENVSTQKIIHSLTTRNTPQVDPRKVRLSDSRQGVEKRRVKVSLSEIGNVDSKPFIRKGKSIKEAQVMYLEEQAQSAEEEFMKVPKKKDGSTFRAAHVTPNKNRYGDILPYDDTRVKLRTAEDGNDYINANFVTFPNGSNPLMFICSQAPLATTISDQW